MRPGGDLVALVKPQFEAGRQAVGRGGVVRSPEIHRDVILSLMPHVTALGLAPQGIIRSPLVGPKGNVEFLLWCREGAPLVDLGESVAFALSDAPRPERRPRHLRPGQVERGDS
jgi:23S rRNA (cytidine1920-2'-O)/16S rRNA (cytidine1409-2'-O)-methyltransferase